MLGLLGLAYWAWFTGPSLAYGLDLPAFHYYPYHRTGSFHYRRAYFHHSCFHPSVVDIYYRAKLNAASLTSFYCTTFTASCTL